MSPHSFLQRTVHRNLQALPHLRDAGCRNAEVLVSLASAESCNDVAMFPPRDCATIPTKFPSEWRTDVTSAVLQRIGHFRRLGVSNCEQIGHLLVLPRLILDP